MFLLYIHTPRICGLRLEGAFTEKAPSFLSFLPKCFCVGIKLVYKLFGGYLVGNQL